MSLGKGFKNPTDNLGEFFIKLFKLLFYPKLRLIDHNSLF